MSICFFVAYVKSCFCQIIQPVVEFTELQADTDYIMEGSNARKPSVPGMLSTPLPDVYRANTYIGKLNVII